MLAGSADMCAIGFVLTVVWAAPIVAAHARRTARMTAACAQAAAHALAVSAPQWPAEILPANLAFRAVAVPAGAIALGRPRADGAPSHSMG